MKLILNKFKSKEEFKLYLNREYVLNRRSALDIIKDIDNKDCCRLYYWMKKLGIKIRTKSEAFKLIPHEKYSNWKGGRINSRGYIQIYSPNHPRSVNKHIWEHRAVYENYLKENVPNSNMLVLINGVKCLSPKIKIHHINMIKTDNRLENLLPVTKYTHSKNGNHLTVHQCPFCNKKYGKEFEKGIK